MLYSIKMKLVFNAHTIITPSFKLNLDLFGNSWKTNAYFSFILSEVSFFSNCWYSLWWISNLDPFCWNTMYFIVIYDIMILFSHLKRKLSCELFFTLRFCTIFDESSCKFNIDLVLLYGFQDCFFVSSKVWRLLSMMNNYYWNISMIGLRETVQIKFMKC